MSATDLERFIAKVHLLPCGGCWIWEAATTTNGYGHFKQDGKNVMAHRWAYTFFGGTIDGLELDHLCRNRSCVNPAHLEPVTHQENVRRGKASALLVRTHCPNGHEYNAVNTYARPDGKGRECKECSRERSREYQSRKRSHQ
jgi:hypothetical protein